MAPKRRADAHDQDCTRGYTKVPRKVSAEFVGDGEGVEEEGLHIVVEGLVVQKWQ